MENSATNSIGQQQLLLPGQQQSLSPTQSKPQLLTNNEIFEHAIEILKKKQRNHAETLIGEDKKFAEQMLTSLSFFQQFDMDPSFQPYASKCAEVIELKVYPRGTPVFLFGERGDNVFFVLKGQAAIYIPKSEADKLRSFKMQTKFYKVKRKILSLRDKGKEIPLKMIEKYNMRQQRIQNQIEGANDEYRHQTDSPAFISPFIYRIVHISRQGSQFGELSVLFNKNRTATVAAYEEDLYLLQVRGSDYIHIFSDLLSKLNFNLYCLERAFPGSRKSLLATLSNCFSSQVTKFKLNDTIYLEGKVSDKIYLLKKGSVEFRKVIGEERTGGGHGEGGGGGGGSSNTTGNLSNRDVPGISKGTAREIIKDIHTINEGELFGHEAMLLKNPLRFATAVSTYYETEVIFIPKQSFNKVVQGTLEQIDMRKLAVAFIDGLQQKVDKLKIDFPNGFSKPLTIEKEPSSPRRQLSKQKSIKIRMDGDQKRAIGASAFSIYTSSNGQGHTATTKNPHLPPQLFQAMKNKSQFNSLSGSVASITAKGLPTSTISTSNNILSQAIATTSENDRYSENNQQLLSDSKSHVNLPHLIKSQVINSCRQKLSVDLGQLQLNQHIDTAQLKKTLQRQKEGTALMLPTIESKFKQNKKKGNQSMCQQQIPNEEEDDKEEGQAKNDGVGGGGGGEGWQKTTDQKVPGQPQHQRMNTESNSSSQAYSKEMQHRKPRDSLNALQPQTTVSKKNSISGSQQIQYFDKIQQVLSHNLHGNNLSNFSNRKISESYQQFYEFINKKLDGDRSIAFSGGSGGVGGSYQLNEYEDSPFNKH